MAGGGAGGSVPPESPARALSLRGDDVLARQHPSGEREEQRCEPDRPRCSQRVMQSQTVHDKMMKIAEIHITEAIWPEDRAPIARLMREYVEALEADISFQDFESEHAGLPGKYARPEGVVLVGRTADEAVGIAAYRPFEHSICEIKRLYVFPRA